jgi:hypothetical protein
MVGGFIETFKKLEKCDESTPIIIGGDFNTFKGTSHMDVILKNSGLHHLSNGVKFSDGLTQTIKSHASLNFYPYDFGLGFPKEEETKLTDMSLLAIDRRKLMDENKLLINRDPLNEAILDHILGLNIVTTKVEMLVQPFSDVPFQIDWLEKPEMLKNYVKTSNDLNIPAFPSDHFPVLAGIMVRS